MNFRVGQKVVCIVDDWKVISGTREGNQLPEFRRIYTIREKYVHEDGRLFLRFVEIVNPIKDSTHGPFEAAFRATKFRPVVTRKTDISIFKAMLNPQKLRTDA